MPLEFTFDPTMQFIIPFLFVLAVVFGVLQMARIFKNKAVAGVIAIAIAFFAASYGPFLTLLWTYLPTVTWFFIGMFFIVFVLEVFGIRGGKDKEFREEAAILQGAILFILLALGWMIAEAFPLELPYIGSGQNLILVLGIVFILLIFWSAFKISIKGEKVRPVGIPMPAPGG